MENKEEEKKVKATKKKVVNKVKVKKVIKDNVKVIKVKEEPKIVIKEEKKPVEVKEVVLEEQKTGFKVLEVIIIMAITVVLGIFIGAFFTSAKLDQRKVTCKVIREDVQAFVDVYDDLVNDYYKTVDKEELMNSAINGMVYSLEDQHSMYVSPKAAKQYEEELAGSFIGIGVEVIATDEYYPVVKKVMDNSPAKEAGLLEGDVIKKVDGKDVTGMDLSSVVALIKVGKVGDKVKLTIARNTVEQDIAITKGNIELFSVTGSTEEKDGKKIGIITIDTFAQNSYIQFRNVYEKIEKENVVGLVIDVRGNGGGYLSSAKEIASLFLDKGAAIYQKDTKGEIEVTYNENEKVIDLPVVFIADRGSASASELLILALAENREVTVVGTRTFGKGSIQKLLETSNGGLVKYTAQHWLSPKGNSIDGVGIEPKIEVETTEKYRNEPTRENDVQLDKALEEIVK